MSPSDLQVSLAAILRARQPANILGAPGTGKSSIVYQAAAGIYNGSTIASAVGGFPAVPWFYAIRAVDRDPIDFRGVLYVKDGKAEWTTPDIIDRLREAPDGGVICIEELPQAVPAVQCVLRELLLERAIGGHRIPDKWTVVATGNRQEDRAGAGRLLSHVASSVIMLTLEPSMDDWQRWALERGIKSEIRGFLRFKPDMLHNFDPARQVNVDPRAWERLHNIFDVVPDRLRFEVFKGIVGEGPAGGFIDFVQLYAKLPDPDGILADPRNAPVPTESSVNWALIGAIGDRIKKGGEKTAKAAAIYAQRMKKEFAVGLVLDILGMCSQATMWDELRGFVTDNIHLFRTK